MLRNYIISIQLILLFAIYGVKSEECLFIGCQCGKDVIYGDYVVCNASDTLPRGVFPTRNPGVSLSDYYHITFQNFELINMPSVPLFNRLNVSEIIFVNNGIQKLSKENFQNMIYLETLEIQDKSLNTIETGTFSPIVDSLRTLKLKYGDYNSQRITQFNENIRLLKNLQILDLSHNKIESVDNTIFRDLENLMEIDLTDNLISNIAANTFSNKDLLGSLILSKNKISDLNIIFRALESLSISLLDLSYNNIENLPDFPSTLDRLVYLDLTGNKIRTINKDTFKNVGSLNYLYLNENNIESIDDDAFLFPIGLIQINLRNNKLSSVPVIKNLGRISFLDLSNQNGQLKEIKDYSFQRDKPLLPLMEILLIGNDVTFGKKAFCLARQQSSYIGRLIVSYKTFNDMNICTTRQLERPYQSFTRPEINFIATDSDTNLAACNCDLKSSFDFYNLVFPSNCNLPTQCDNKVTVDVCINQVDYSCPGFVYPTAETTTGSSVSNSGDSTTFSSTISTAPLTTSSSNRVKPVITVFIIQFLRFLKSILKI